jgi:hypothetical protein
MDRRRQMIGARQKWSSVTPLAVISIVFGILLALILMGYDPAVATAAVTGTSMAAAELVRHIQGTPPNHRDEHRGDLRDIWEDNSTKERGSLQVRHHDDCQRP